MKELSCAFTDAKVLVAEDNEFALEIIKHILGLFKIVPDLAKDGVEAMECVKKNKYDLLILDIHMPRKNGNEVAREIRMLSIEQPLIIALTASAFASEREESMAAGFDDYLYKPIEIEKIEVMLKKYLHSKLVKP
ncbi:MAG: response regulator [Chlamydiales bacterium]